MKTNTRKSRNGNWSYRWYTASMLQYNHSKHGLFGYYSNLVGSNGAAYTTRVIYYSRNGDYRAKRFR